MTVALAQKRSFSVPIGTTAIIGSEYLSAAALDFIEIALALYPNDVKTIYFDAHNLLPKKEDDSTTAWYTPSTNSIAVNLQELFAQTIRHTQEEDNSAMFCSVRNELWARFCVMMLHEMGHAFMFKTMEFDVFSKVDEEELNEWSILAVMELGKTHDMEPMLMEHEPFFGKLFQDELDLAAIGKEKEDWLIFQLELLDSGMMYNDTEREVELMSFHEYQRHMSVDPASKEWPKKTISISPQAPEPAESVIQLPDRPIVTEVVVPMVTAVAVPPDAPANEALIAIDPIDENDWVADIVEELSTAEDGFVNDYYAADNDVQQQTVILGGPQTTAPLQPQNRKFAPVPITDAPPLNPAITYDIWKEAVYNIYIRAGNHLFAEAARWQPNNPIPFINPGHCTSALSMADIPHAIDILMAMDYTRGDGNQVKQQVIQNGVVFGKITAKGLPCVVLYLNRAGKMIKRTIQAMNPNTGSSRSQMAQTKRCCNIWDNNKSDSLLFWEKCPLSLIENKAHNLQVHVTPKTNG